MKPYHIGQSLPEPRASGNPLTSQTETNRGNLEDLVKSAAEKLHRLIAVMSSRATLLRPSSTAVFEVTGFIKRSGPLTKQISLSEDGTLISDGSACVMTSGYAWRQKITGLAEFATFISGLKSNQALALGALSNELTPIVEVVSKKKIRRNNSQNKYDLISRTNEYLKFRAGSPALVLIDVDTKGMPQAIRDRIAEYGGYVPALISVMPALRTAGYVTRSSTSSGLRRANTGETLPGSDGAHIFVLIRDGADSNRFLHDLHQRCSLAGLGWCRVDAASRLLNRSIVDRMVASPERLVF